MTTDTTAEPALYTRPGCAESAKVRAWLADRGTAFTERDVSNDSEAAQALVESGIFATPLLIIGKEKVLGFRPETLRALKTSTESVR